MTIKLHFKSSLEMAMHGKDALTKSFSLKYIDETRVRCSEGSAFRRFTAKNNYFLILEKKGYGAAQKT